jgi:DNA-binding transcriptional LysR family regulator
MNRIDIESFLAITKYGTITQAAIELNMSQPALSKRIHLLETELGYPLIIRKRGSRTITLTDKGAAFVSIALRWISIWEDTIALASNSPRDTFRLASPDSPYLYVLPNVFKSFTKQHPNVNLQLRTANYEEAYRSVENGSLHMAFTGTNYYYKNILITPAYREKMYFICRQDSSYPKVINPEILSIDKAIFSGYSDGYTNWFKRWFGITAPFLEVDLNAQVEDFLTMYDSDTWTIAPASVALNYEKNKLLTCRTLTDTPPDRIIYYLLKVGTIPNYVPDFINLLKTTITDMPGIISML